jgi:hypothetical protein
MKPTTADLEITAQTGSVDPDLFTRHRRRWVFERVLLAATDATYAGLKPRFQTELFNIERVATAVEALKRCTTREYEIVICEVTPSLPADMFYVAVQRLRPTWPGD